MLWHRVYDPILLRRDEDLIRELLNSDVRSETYKSELLVEPWELKDTEGRHYRSLNSYVTAWMALPPPPPPLSAPARIIAPSTWHQTIDVSELKLIGSEELEKNLSQTWKSGSTWAKEALDRFLGEVFPTFGDSRCRRDLMGTSRLSPHIRFGEVSPRKVYHSVRQEISKFNSWSTKPDEREAMRRTMAEASRAFLKNLCMRDFSYHTFFYNPNMLSRPLVPEFAAFPWSDDSSALKRWRTGTTGYPIVDAAMRQLIKDGWIHNNLR